MVIGDFFFYWYHRTMHRSEVLWQHHKMHHMDRELDALTASRENWIGNSIVTVLMTVPVAVLFKLDEFDLWKIGLFAAVLMTTIQTVLQLGHMNVRLQAGKASVIWCTPQVHRIHHSCLPQHRDKNFAFVFPLWDVIFGTYYPPKRDEFPPTGVEGEREIGSFWESQIFALREWWKMFCTWRSHRAAP